MSAYSVRRKRQRAVRLLKKILVFVLSRAGLCAFMIGYMMVGAVVFKAIEAPYEEEVRGALGARRHEFVEMSWRVVYYNETLGADVNADVLYHGMLKYKKFIHDYVKQGYNVKDHHATERLQWTTTGAFLYSLTVITTVGYGNIACRTYFGKAMTILYAVVGIPLMLLFLAMTGNSLGVATKFVYRAYVRLKLRIIAWRNKRRGAGKVTSVLSQLIRERLYYSAAIYGMVPPGIDQDMWNDSQAKVREIVVPVYLSMLIMVLYLVAGATLFCVWEEWQFLDSLYFCFISLALIGFGDMFPGAAVAGKEEARNKMIICSGYLLFGMALIAMCFQLGQEDVVKNLRRLFARCRRVMGGAKEEVSQEDMAAAEELLMNYRERESNGVDPLYQNNIKKNGPVGLMVQSSLLSMMAGSPKAAPALRRCSSNVDKKHSSLRRRSSLR